MIAVSGLLQSGIRLPERSIFPVIRSNGGGHGPFGQFLRLRDLPLISLGVGRKCQSKVLVSLFACKPALLICHRSGVRIEKGESGEMNMEKVAIQFSCLGIANDLPCFVKSLLAKSIIG